MSRRVPAVSDVAGAVDTAVSPLLPVVGPTPGSPASAPSLSGAAAVGLTGAATVSALILVATAAHTSTLTALTAAPLALGGASSSAPAGPLGGEPFAPGREIPGSLPGGGAAGSSGGPGGPGGAAPSAGVISDSLFVPASVRSGLSGLSADDHVPAGPVADHDISPD